MNTHNIGFYEDLTNIIFELSSNTHLISSAVTVLIAMDSLHKGPYVQSIVCLMKSLRGQLARD